MRTVDPLHGLAAFLAVAEHQSFTAAAASVGMTRATISAQVADLESRGQAAAPLDAAGAADAGGPGLP